MGQDVHNHGHEHDDHNHEHGHVCGGGIPKFNTRDLLIREDIMGKAKELAELICTSEEVKQFKQAESQINANERIQQLIASMKKKQKEIVAFESFENKKMVAKIEGEIDTLHEQLENIPIVAQFQQSQSDINYLLQLVISVIRDTVSEKISVEGGTAAAPSECSD